MIPAATVLYNPDAGLLRTLLSSLQQCRAPIYIFINGSIEAKLMKELSYIKNCQKIQSPVNLGLGAALNALIDLASADGHQHIVLFDQDSTPDDKFLPKIWARYQEVRLETKQLAAVGPLLVTPIESGYKKVKYWWRPSVVAPTYNENAVRPVDFLPTSGTLINIEAWKLVGPFRADYFIGGIDVEWGYRAWSLGWKSMVIKDIKMIHRWGEDAPRGAVLLRFFQSLRQSETRLFYYIRNATNGLRLHHMPLRWKVAQTIQIAVQILFVLMFKSPQIKPSFFLKAMRDGWAGRLGSISTSGRN